MPENQTRNANDQNRATASVELAEWVYLHRPTCTPAELVGILEIAKYEILAGSFDCVEEPGA